MYNGVERYVHLSRYDFLTIFVGIFIGLAVGKLVSFIGQIAASKESTKIPPAHGIYICLMFFLLVHYWWTLWEAKAIGVSSFYVFIYLLALPLLMYIATAILCPESMISEGKTMENYLHERKITFYSIIEAILLVGAIQGIFIWHQSVVAVALRIVAAMSILPVAFSRSRRAHLWLSITLFVLFIVYTLTSSHLYPW